MLANIAALASVVIVLVLMGYFLLGSLPLLVLEHDTPLDARFIRGFFDLYYRGVFVAAAASAVAFAFAGQAMFSAGMAVLATVVAVARRTVIPRMDCVRAAMAHGEAASVRRFRRLHVAGMLLNALQVTAVAVSLLFLRL